MNAWPPEQPPGCRKCGRPMEFEGLAKPERDQPGFHIYSCFECEELVWLNSERAVPRGELM